MDGLRKVPDNIPNKELVGRYLDKPLTKVPDPFGTHGSYGEHNNARLRAFLDQFGFDYEFLSATQCYTSGRFDAALLKVLEHYDQVMAIMLPSLRAERAQTYSPFLPISPDRRRAAGADRRSRRRRPAPSSMRRKRRRNQDAGDRRTLQAAMEAGLGDAMARAWRRL